MPIVYNLIRDLPHYRHDAFNAGLEAAGYRVKTSISKPPSANDILLMWNRYGSFDCRAKQFEKAGAIVLIAENGYYGQDSQGRRLYAISKNQHHHGGAEIDPLRMTWPIAPANKAGDTILVCEQRGIGSQLMRSPPEWAEKTAAKLQALGHRTRIRKHPGKLIPPVSLADDLRDCKLCVVWSSTCGVEALARGVPVVYDAPRWIAEDSAMRLSEWMASGARKIPIYDRLAGLCNAASNQWCVDEIAQGLPFERMGVYAKN